MRFERFVPRGFLISLQHKVLLGTLIFFFSMIAAAESQVQVESLGLDAALVELGATLQWDPLSRTGALQMNGQRLVFRSLPSSSSESKVSILNGSNLIRSSSPYFSSGELRFPRAFIDAVKSAVANIAETEHSRYRIAAILVDPGHGGKDPGAMGSHVIDGKKVNLVEKHIVLKVAKEIYEKLVTKYPDKRVLLTRSTDVYPTLEQRVDLANSIPLTEYEAVVFISIHANASFSKSARGYEVWYLSPEYRRTVIDQNRYADSKEVMPILNDMLEEEFTTESIIMARSILKRFDESIGKLSPSRGLRAEEWFVVRNARMPSVLVELGYLTNAEEARLFTDDAYLRKLSDAVYNGTVDFVTTFERSGGFTAIR